MGMLDGVAGKAGQISNDLIGGGIKKLGIGEYPEEDIPMYHDFLSNILQDADNSVSVSSYWVVFFTMPYKNAKEEDKGLIGSITSAIGDAVGGFVDDLKSGLNKKRGPTIKFGPEPTPWTVGDKTRAAVHTLKENIENGIMLVQSITIPSDGFGVNRDSDIARMIGGFAPAPTTGPRTAFPDLEMTFLENNSSITDLVLRPWVIHSSYASLKYAMRATVNCYNLTRSPTGFRVNKEFIFHDVVPISVDDANYTYTPATDFGKRQVRFVYSHYSVKDGNHLKDSLLSSLANWGLQKARGLITGLVESGVDVVAGGASQVITNISGNFKRSVDDHMNDIVTRTRTAAQEAEASIIDKGQRAIDRGIGVDPAKDHLMRGGDDFPTSGTSNNPSPRIPVNANSEDSRVGLPNPPKSSAVINNAVYTIINTNRSDTPDTQALNLQEVVVGSGDVPIAGAVKSSATIITPNKGDTPDTQALNLQEVVAEGGDVPTVGAVKSSATVIAVNKGDTASSKDLKVQEVVAKGGDVPTAGAVKSSATIITPNKGDTASSKALNLSKVEINNNDA